MNKNTSKQYKSKEHVSKTSPGKHCEMDKDVLDLSSDLHQLYLCLLWLSVISQGVVHGPEWSIRITWAIVKNEASQMPLAVYRVRTTGDEIQESVILQFLEELCPL